jgi:hypothetical protein
MREGEKRGRFWKRGEMDRENDREKYIKNGIDRGIERIV